MNVAEIYPLIEELTAKIARLEREIKDLEKTINVQKEV
jgi:peptidoglycan hydrolase CwlO-like protein